MKKTVFVISILVALPFLVCSCTGLSKKPVSTMSNIDLSKEFYALDLKLNRDKAMFTPYEWNRFMGRHTDLGIELSLRNYWPDTTDSSSSELNRLTEREIDPGTELSYRNNLSDTTGSNLN